MSKASQSPESVYPRMADLNIEPKPGSSNEFRVSLADQPSPMMELGNGPVRVMQEFDGERNCTEIAAALNAAGLQLPGPDFILALAVTLARHGFVSLGENAQASAQSKTAGGIERLELLSVNPLRHKCTGCGRSCEGHNIGPLDHEFLQRLPNIMATLGPKYSDLATFDGLPYEEVEVHGSMLKKLMFHPERQGKGCVFLGEDRLCRIHKHMGSATKPIICRLFPLEVVETEDELRVGIGRCYMSHLSFGDATIKEQTPEEITGISSVNEMIIARRSLNPREPRNLIENPDTDPATIANWRLEQQFMNVLLTPTTTWESLLCAVFEATLLRPLPSGRLTESQPLLELFAERLRHSGISASAAREEERVNVVEGGHIYEMFALFDALSALQARPWQGMTSAQREYGLYVLSEMIYLRSWLRHPSLQLYIMIAVLGLLAASWIAEESEDPEAFAFALTGWTRHFNFSKNILQIFDGLEDYVSFVESIEERLSH